MGAFLEKPKTDKISKSGEGNDIRYGVSAMQGWRIEMEDAHTCEIGLPIDDKACFFGVFDGHAGSKVAKHCSEKLRPCIEKSYDTQKKDHKEWLHHQLLDAAIKDGFIKLDADMSKEWASGVDRSGTTAVVAVITPEHIIWGNCGDSRGILCRNGQEFFSTTDHKPYNDPERARIERAGGTVMMQRVNGSLAVSRALGDFDYKRNDTVKPTEQLVSPEPEITITERDPSGDQFLLLACDGIFDVMTNEDVVSFVSKQLKLTSDLSKICNTLIDLCLNKNSRDNMSVVLVTFPAAPEVSQEAIDKEGIHERELVAKIAKELSNLAEEAQNSLDLEETLVFSVLLEKKLLPESELYSKKQHIIDVLAEKRKEKFGDSDFTGSSDLQDAPPDFLGGAVQGTDPDAMPMDDSALMDGANPTTSNNKTIM